MTPERIKKATELIGAGVSATKIIPAMQAIPGPKINKSRIYEWVREFKMKQRPANNHEPARRSK